ncbi:hypothetical protein ATANTOWER_009079 [Ataeniobius toweri]|uniref:Secreted protein n=1 Tax=Ataeniobius toweri TaxID=208326 RepID=A0ABU7A073_9TELE|nr:hypothetical protein [Ataeniobius toweri]
MFCCWLQRPTRVHTHFSRCWITEIRGFALFLRAMFQLYCRRQYYANHFTKDCFENSHQYTSGFAERLRLKKNSVPTVRGKSADDTNMRLLLFCSSAQAEL